MGGVWYMVLLLAIVRAQRRFTRQKFDKKECVNK